MILLCLVLFLACPALSVPMSLGGVFLKRKYALFLLVMAMILLSSFYMPFGDQYRYYEDFNEISEWTSEMFWGEDGYRRLSLPILIMWGVERMGLNFEHVRMCCLIIGYLIWYLVIRQDIQKNETEGRIVSFIFFLMMFLTFPYLPICQGYRQGMGACFALAAIDAYAEDRRTQMIVWMVFSVLCHPFYFLFLVLLLFSSVSLSMRGLLVLCLFSLGGEHMIDLLYSVLAPIMPSQFAQLHVYFDSDGSWRQVGDKLSAIHQVGEMLNRIVFIGYNLLHAAVCFSVSKMRGAGKVTHVDGVLRFSMFVLWLFVIWCMTTAFFSLNYRLQYVMIMLISISLVRLMRIHDKRRLILCIVFPMMLLLVLYFTIGYKELFMHLEYREILECSATGAFEHSYDDDYVYGLINMSGQFWE